MRRAAGDVARSGTLLLQLIMAVAAGCGDGGRGSGPGDTPPRAALEACREISRGVAVLFDASRSGDPDPGDKITEYTFSFDDGTVMKRDTPFAVHAFASEGAHSLTLTVRDSFGQEDRLTTGFQVVTGRGPQVRFALPENGMPRYSDIPFPNSLFVGEDGKISVAGIPYKMILFGPIMEKALKAMDGFGTSSAVFFWTGGRVDDSTLPRDARESVEPGSSLFLINIDPHSDGYLERHPVTAQVDPEKNVIAVLPEFGVPLRESTTYAAVLTTGIRGAGGGNIVPSGQFAQVRDGVQGEKALARARDLYLPVMDLLEGQPDTSDRRVLAGVAVFRTQTVTRDLEAMNGVLDHLGPSHLEMVKFFTDDPFLCLGAACGGDLKTLLGTPESGYEDRAGLDNPGGMAHSGIETVVTRASFRSPWFKNTDTSSDEYGAFVHGEDGKPVVQAWKELSLSLVIPSVEREGGYPVAILQHGLSGRRDFVMAAANELARNGIASIAIDAVGHGDRYECPLPGPLFEAVCRPRDELFNYTGAAGADGLPDPEALTAPLGFFELFASGLSFRDNFRQSVADLMWLVRLIKGRQLDLSAIGSPELDGNRIFFIGDSLGAIIGGTFMTAEVNVPTGVLNVAGGGIAPTLLVNSPGINGQYGDLVRLAFSLSPEDLASTYSQFVNLAQTVLDPGDPINYAPYALKAPLLGGRPKNILQIEVMWDHLVPNSSNEALARAFGLALLEPCYHEVPSLDPVPSPYAGSEGFTSALVQYFPAGHGTDIGSQYFDLEWQPGFPFPAGRRFRKLEACPSETAHPWCHLSSPIAPVQEQIVRFFSSYLENGVPEVVSTFTPETDFDHDGRSDEEEIRMGTDPLIPGG